MCPLAAGGRRGSSATRQIAKRSLLRPHRFERLRANHEDLAPSRARVPHCPHVRGLPVEAEAARTSAPRRRQAREAPTILASIGSGSNDRAHAGAIDGRDGTGRVEIQHSDPAQLAVVRSNHCSACGETPACPGFQHSRGSRPRAGECAEPQGLHQPPQQPKSHRKELVGESLASPKPTTLAPSTMAPNGSRSSSGAWASSVAIGIAQSLIHASRSASQPA
jgi:hypothetical protein